MGYEINALGERLNYEVALKSLESQGVTVNNGELAQSYLRTEAVLDPGLSTFKFPIQKNSANSGTQIYPTMKLLGMQDAFYATNIAYWIEVYDMGASAPIRDLYRYVPFTYPSETLNRIGAVTSKLGYKLWSGVLSLTVAGSVIIRAWDIKRHLEVPRTQKSAVNGPFPNSEFYIDHDQFNGLTSGRAPFEPHQVFIGTNDTDLQIQFPEDLASAISSTMTIKMVLTMNGLLAQNVTILGQKNG